MIKVFISYSHVDENYCNELKKHLMSLQHQGIVESWHDRCIMAGEEWAGRIDEELSHADIILLLISSDFIASHYCYELEMKEALTRHESKTAVVIPIILRPCHWTGLPFGKLQAATKNGKVVEKYPSLDDAFLEIIQNIEIAAKKIFSTKNNISTEIPPSSITSFEKMSISESKPTKSELPRSNNLAIPKSFTDHDKDTFITGVFKFIANLFEGSLEELKNRNPEIIDTSFQKVDARSFEATIYRQGKQISQCGIWLGNPLGVSKGPASIIFSHTGLEQKNGFNESMSVKDNSNMLGLEPLGVSLLQRTENTMLTNQGAAEYYWDMFFEPVTRHKQ